MEITQVSVELLRAEIERFIGGANPQIICVTGQWGVGKTRTWNSALELCRISGRVGMDKYAYVSLFGRESVIEIQRSIIEGLVDSRTPGAAPSVASYQKSVSTMLRSLGLVSKLHSFLTNG
jgi:hypothetical protein